MGDRAVLEQRHLVGEQDGRGTVCDNDSGRVGEHVAQGFLDQGLGVHVERGQRVVEHEDARIGQRRTGEREPLPLPAGQAHPLLADAGVEAERQVSHELRLSDLDRCVDLLWRRVRVAEREVLADRHREQRGILERRRNDLAQHRQRKLAYVDAVDQHGAFGDVAQARISPVNTDLPEPVAPTRATVSPARPPGSDDAAPIRHCRGTGTLHRAVRAGRR